MDSEMLQILNEELIELKRQTKLSEQRLDLHSQEFKATKEILKEHKEILKEHRDALDQHRDTLNQHKAGFEILFKNMEKMGERLDVELKRLRDE